MAFSEKVNERLPTGDLPIQIVKFDLRDAFLNLIHAGR
jgi:hypothetical protein